MFRCLAGLALAVFVAACAGSSTTALGFTAAPAGLDPNSPMVAAKDIAFVATDVAVPAGRPFILVFENQEAAAHNVSIYTDVTVEKRIFEGTVIGEPSTIWYPIPALLPGTYVFQCDVHPGIMLGRLHAG